MAFKVVTTLLVAIFVLVILVVAILVVAIMTCFHPYAYLGVVVVVVVVVGVVLGRRRFFSRLDRLLCRRGLLVKGIVNINIDREEQRELINGINWWLKDMEKI